MSNGEKYENLVLGSGAAGRLLTWTLASEGHRTALVERGLLGGACPNVACMPSKNIIHSAKVAALAKRGPEFGLKFNSLSVDMATVQRRKQMMVADIQEFHLNRTAASGTELFRGEARFVAPRTIEVALRAGGTKTIVAERVFIDVGSRASVFAIPGLAEANPMTHVEALDLDRLPEHLIVLGGGYVGLELSQAFRRFGSRVTVIETASQLADHEDPDIGAALLDLFHDDGIDVLLGSRVRQAEGRSGQRVTVQVESGNEKHVLAGTDLLLAIGRTPNTDALDLEKTAVQTDEHGYISVNERLLTTCENVWAMGDCAGSPKFTHVSVDDFRIVNANLNGASRTTTRRLVPFCMFTDPELARVGKNEIEARREGIEYRLAKMPMAEVLRTKALSEPRGFMKALIANDSDEILGFTAFGVEASELMVAVQTAMLGHLPYTILRDAILAHPTISEGLGMLLANVPAR
jgi:pyruvate/2-oxoglutarate dehydrogenase complex dihydrolipoamide dehydrogenase (E3) component